MTTPAPKRDLVRDVQDLLRYEARGASIAPAVERIAVEVATLQDELAALRKAVRAMLAADIERSNERVGPPPGWTVGASPIKKDKRG